MLYIVIPLLIAIVGAFAYGFATNPKIQNMGLVLFACGSLVLTASTAGEGFHVGSGVRGAR